DCIYSKGVKDGAGDDKGVCFRGTRSAEDGQCTKPEDYVTEETADNCDAKDNDCDGEVDENCTCTTGQTDTCYTGPEGTAGTGICAKGTRTCNDEESWGPCGDTPPGDEVCADDGSGNGADEDCDGVKDEGCSCEFSGTAQGVCSKGRKVQGDDGSGVCKAPTNYEETETNCDRKDNDCDGGADEGCECDYKEKDKGVCKNLTRNKSGTCPKPSSYEDPEQTCDGQDNDCDSDVDGDDSDLMCMCMEGDAQECYTGPTGTEGVGICEHGSQTCSGGSWGSCDGEQTPKEEDCGTFDTDENCGGDKNAGCACTYDPDDSRKADSDGSNDNGVCPGQEFNDDNICIKPTDFEDPEQTCDDSRDNDCDGETNCADADCDTLACGTGS
ncbi:MAG: hypothetical protein ABEN55_18515, partial [Bradymonadaceae bacterium]